jgi:hypothetical protein
MLENSERDYAKNPLSKSTSFAQKRHESFLSSIWLFYLILEAQIVENKLFNAFHWKAGENF